MKRKIIQFLICFFPLAGVYGSDLDSLRVVIRSLQTDIELNKAVVASLSTRFNAVNEKIYVYKTEQNAGTNPFSQLRMQDALKVSHLLADSLDSNTVKLRADALRLQHTLLIAQQQIDVEIQRQLDLAKQTPLNRSQQKEHIREIGKLEKEKAEYAAGLQTMNVEEEGWQKIVNQPQDTLRRLRLKLTLLQDFVVSLDQAIASAKEDIEKNRNDRKTYVNLLDFYKELDESLDDQDIFDRNRIEEVRTKIENLDNEFVRLTQNATALNRDMTVLRAKVERFKLLIVERETP